MSDEDLERFAADHGLPALLDHLGLDGLGNYIARLEARVKELEGALGSLAQGLNKAKHECDRLRKALELISTMTLTPRLARFEDVLNAPNIARRALEGSE